MDHNFCLPDKEKGNETEDNARGQHRKRQGENDGQGFSTHY